AGERPAPRRHTGRPDVELPDEPRSALVDDCTLDTPVPPERSLSDPLQEQVEPDRQRPDDPLPEAIVGHIAEPDLLARGDREPRHRGAVQENIAVRRLALTRDHLGERALTVPVDAGDAEDLAFLQVERHA